MNARLQLRGALGVMAAVAMISSARADVVAVANRSHWWRAWSFEPGVVAGLFFIGALYASGLRARRRRSPGARTFHREAACFYGGWLVLALALLSPLHPLGSELFAAHMTQHELLMIVGAPLLVLGRPLVVLLWAIPRPLPGGPARVRRESASAGLPAEGPCAHAQGYMKWWLGAVVRWVGSGHGLLAWVVHATVLWGWHAPRLFEAAVRYGPVHALQHLTFLGAAVWFWQAVLLGARRQAGLAVLSLFTTALHTTALGALLTFAVQPWYAPYLATPLRWGLTPLEDQQLGGLIMWVPGGLVYVIAGLALFARWLRLSERSTGFAGPKPTCALHPSS